MSPNQVTPASQTVLPSDIDSYIRNISTDVKTDVLKENIYQHLKEACIKLLNGDKVTLAIEDIKRIRPKIVLEFIEMLPSDTSLQVDFYLADKRGSILRSVITATMVDEDLEDKSMLYLDECLVFIYIVNSIALSK